MRVSLFTCTADIALHMFVMTGNIMPPALIPRVKELIPIEKRLIATTIIPKEEAEPTLNSRKNRTKQLLLDQQTESNKESSKANDDKAEKREGENVKTTTTSTKPVKNASSVSKSPSGLGSPRHTRAQCSPRAVKRITLQLIPKEAIIADQIVRAGYNPLLQLTFHAKKPISFIIQHMNKKWVHDVNGVKVRTAPLISNFFTCILVISFVLPVGSADY